MMFNNRMIEMLMSITLLLIISVRYVRLENVTTTTIVAANNNLQITTSTQLPNLAATTEAVANVINKPNDDSLDNKKQLVESNQPYVNTELNKNTTGSGSSLSSGDGTSMVKENTFANFAQYNGNLLVNHSNAENGGSGAPVVVAPKSSASSACVNCGGISLTLILVLVFLIMAIVGIILAALFVMRRRFSIWRLNGTKSNGCVNDCNDGTNGVLTNVSSSSENNSIDNKCVTSEVNEKAESSSNKKTTTAGLAEANSNNNNNENCEKSEKVTSSSCLTSVENKQALMDIGAPMTVKVDNQGHSNQAAECSNEQEIKQDAVAIAAAAAEAQNDQQKLEQDQQQQQQQQQASPSSSSPLIESHDESTKLITSSSSTHLNNQDNTDSASNQLQSQNNQQQQQQSNQQALLHEQASSSSSLIVNVLNELSESVAAKLASRSPAACKADPEKQPLNSNE